MEKRIRAEGLEVFYREEGRGEPLLILHGWRKSSADFSSLQKLLAKDFKTYVPDLPAFGKTPKPSRPWNTKDYALFVKKFSQEIGLKKFSLLGHSFGGRIAIELAVLYPGVVEKLILTGVPILRKGKLKRLFFCLIAKIARLLFFLPPFCLFKTQMRNFFYFMIGERDYYRAQGIRREILKKVIAYRQERNLPKIQAPTLIVWGENDQITPIAHAQKLHQKIKNSTLEIVLASSHGLPYEKPKEFYRRIVSFLGE